ncbi:hypothetical protein H0H93_014718 [Arthromyces matolae]|nr:hypothetical protein H0H93_014718 [Arthromyces matolae]
MSLTIWAKTSSSTSSNRLDKSWDLDHETALSAVRNLNNTDVGGRPLRIDLADSDPFLEGKTTVRGELIDGGTPGPSEPRQGWRGGGGDRHDSSPAFPSLPPGVQIPAGASALDYISQTLATMAPNQLMEVLAQMKAYVITHPEQARTLLVNNPQFAYALFQALLLNKIVDSAILQRMLAATSISGGPPQAMAPPSVARVPAPPPPHLQQPPTHPQYNQIPPQAYPPPPTLQHSQPPIQGHAQPPAAAMYGHMPPPPHTSMPPPQVPPYAYRPPPLPSQTMAPPQQPAPQPAPPASPALTDDQRAMIMQVFSLTPEQINAYPEAERTAIQRLRTEYSQIMGGVGA